MNKMVGKSLDINEIRKNFINLPSVEEIQRKYNKLRKKEFQEDYQNLLSIKKTQRGYKKLK